MVEVRESDVHNAYIGAIRVCRSPLWHFIFECDDPIAAEHGKSGHTGAT